MAWIAGELPIETQSEDSEHYLEGLQQGGLR